MILQRTDGSGSAQNHTKTPFSTLIEPSRAVESRGHHPTTLPEGGAGDGDERVPGGDLAADAAPERLHAAAARAAVPDSLDEGAALAELFGIAYSVPAEHRRYYEGILVNIPFVSSGGTYANASEESWRLPLPAVFVVGQDGTIAFSEGYADFRVRPEPSDVMEALVALVPSSHPSR